MSPDPVGTDLLIAERRASELIAVKDDPDARARTLESYLETVDRLRSEAGTEDQIRIASTLDSQRALLKKLGILLSQSDPNEVPPVVPVVPEDATVAPTALPTAQTPGLVATALPSLTPTLPAPPEVLFPTIDVPPELVPTIHVPPPIR